MRILAGVPVFFLVTFLATALSDFMPGSAAFAILGEGATPEAIANLNHIYGYDRPVWERYIDWLGKLFQGDLGTTLFSQQSVAGLLVDRAAVTFEIAIFAMTVALVISIPLALLTAMRPGGFADNSLRALSSMMLSIPIFVTVVIVGFVFSLWLRILPATGWTPLLESPLDNLGHAAMPIMCMAVHQTAYFYRVSRSEFVATLQEDFVLVARAKGLTTRYILMRHVLRPSLTQVLTVFGLAMSVLLGGSFIVESYFAVPGIGWTMLNSVGVKDMPVVQAILMLAVTVYIVMFILVDIGYAIIDPRVSVS
jgi:peptide/nickel transport system permease protein